MSCGAGTQAAVEIFKDKPVYTANDTLFLGNMTRFRVFDERCSLCGECIINKTGGICPVTNCPKGPAQWAMRRDEQWQMRSGQGKGLCMGEDI